ncbi:MAG: OmpA family protein [Desulfuromonadaceae bacterium]|nr:OmpA family protein [Desulfuromonadaceae bacterium]
MKNISSPLMYLLGVSIVGILMFGCTPTIRENALLEQSKSAFAEAEANPDVQKNAALELQKAKTNLDQAEKLLQEGAEAKEVEHFAYLAKQRTAIAQETANVKLADRALDDASAERNKVLLAARTQEADQAKQLAEAQKRKAALASEESEAQLRKLEAQISELQAVKSKRGLVITLGDVLFDTNKSELRSGAQRTIDKLAKFLGEYPARKVMIEGFTDSTGTAEYNQQLSELRAIAVRDVLEAKGIDSNRIMTRGYGVEFPAASNATAEGRQRNRRVEVIISDEDGNIQERQN